MSVRFGRREAYRVGAGVEFVHEPLVPGVDAVLEDTLDGLEEAILTSAYSRQG